MTRCVVLHPADLASTTRAAWLSLLERAEYGSPLLNPDFAKTVGRVRNDTRIATYHKAGRLVAVLAFHARPGGLARPLAAPFSDLHALVCAPEFDLDLSAALSLAGVRAFRFDALLDGDNRTGCAEADDLVHAVVLDSDIDSFLEARRAANPKRFKNHRRLARQMEREVGALVFTAPETDRDAFDQLLGWKKAQFARTGRHDVLQPRWASELMDLVFAGGVGEAQGLMVSLRAGDQLVAGLFGVRTGEFFNPWIAAYDPAFAAWSPGQVILHNFIEAMPALGLTRCDLGAGHDHYKKYYANAAWPVKTGLVSAPGSALRETALRTALWSLGEHSFPALARKTASARRRADQIAAAELDLGGRLGGALRALTPVRAHPQEDAA